MQIQKNRQFSKILQKVKKKIFQTSIILRLIPIELPKSIKLKPPNAHSQISLIIRAVAAHLLLQPTVRSAAVSDLVLHQQQGDSSS